MYFNQIASSAAESDQSTLWNELKATNIRIAAMQTPECFTDKNASVLVKLASNNKRIFVTTTHPDTKNKLSYAVNLTGVLNQQNFDQSKSLKLNSEGKTGLLIIDAVDLVNLSNETVKLLKKTRSIITSDELDIPLYLK